MSLERHWCILRCIPRSPQSITVSELSDVLARRWGIETIARNLQRDLQALTRYFPITCDEDEKPYRWYFMSDADLIELPSMDRDAALAFRLAEEMLEQAMPRSTYRHLEKYFKNARSTLLDAGHSGYKRWAQRVRVLPRAQALLPAKLKPAVIDAVYEALLEEKQLQVMYQAREDEEPKERVLNPLGLVLRDGAPYLVCTFWEYTDERYLPLQRFSSAVVLDEKRKKPKGFTLDGYLGRGELNFRVGDGDIKLVAWVSEQLATTLQETPLSTEQSLELKDDRWLLKATVPDTQALRGWVMSYGVHIKVTGPKKLRDEIAERYAEGRKLYSSRR